MMVLVELSELKLGSEFKDVEIWDHVCSDTILIEKLYYSAGFEPISYVCTVVWTNHSHLPANILSVRGVHTYVLPVEKLSSYL